MLHTRRQNEFGTWYIPGRKPVISYSFTLMAAVGDAARAAVPAPVAGVLFGAIDDDEVRITAYRSINTAPVAGEGLFDDAGEAELNRLVSAYASEPDLTGLRPVGWYRSRSDEGIQLSEGDVRIWNGFFPHLAQVTLVLRVDQRPDQEQQVRAGFFFRPRHGGSPRTDSSYRTFVVGPAPEPNGSDVGRLAEAVIQTDSSAAGDTDAPQALSEAPPPPSPLNSVDAPSGSNGIAEGVPLAAEATAAGGAAPSDPLEPPSDLFTPPAAPGRYRYVWAATATAALVLASAGSYLAKRRVVPSTIPASQVGLRFSGPPNRLQLVWNAQAALVRNAESAQLRLIDAESDRSELVTADRLGQGRMAVLNRTGLMEARLRLIPREATAAAATVVAQFVGPSSADAQTRDARGVSSLAPLLNELQGLRTSIQSSIEGNRNLTARIAAVRDSLAVRRPDPGERQAQPPAAVASASNNAGSQPAPPASPAAQPPPPQQQQQQPVASAPISSAPGPNFGTDRVPARVTQLPEPPPAPAYSGPTSGKLIWSGFLAPGATVTIDGRRASTGSVNSLLPGVPVRLAVYPAEFSAGGLVIYSASSRHQAGNVTEARSAQNGWMAVRYVYDPARARDVQLAATPNSAGGFKQLQIRGGERPVSVAVIEWAVSQ